MKQNMEKSYLTGDEALDELVATRPDSILGIPFLVGLAATVLFPPPRLPVPMAQVLGAAFIGSGILISIWAVRTMRSRGASPDALRPPATLLTTGAFGFSRNPIYLGFVLFYAGVGLLLNSLWIVLLTPAVVVALTLEIIVRDERLLEKRFGDEFDTYRAKVRRWV